MPIRNINRYTCAATGAIEYDDDLPPGWFRVEDEYFSPEAKVLIANAILANPEIEFGELMTLLGTPTPTEDPTEEPTP